FEPSAPCASLRGTPESRRALFRVRGRRLGIRDAGHLPPTPRPEAVDLDLEREAEEDPDDDDDAKDCRTFEGGVNDDGPDDVGDDQNLEAEQNAAAEGAPQFLVGLVSRLGA